MHCPSIGSKCWKLSPVLICVAGLGFAPRLEAEDIPWRANTAVRFGSVAEGADVLSTPDRFLQSLSRFDRQCRLQAAHNPTPDEFRRHLRAQVIAWTPDDVTRIHEALDRLNGRLGNLLPPWPARILLIKTTGKEEGGAAYCRGTAVILPASILGRSRDNLERLLLHEFFHILSNHQPQLVQSLYPVVGFDPCPEIALPESLAARKITNPDAPLVNCTMELEIDAVPLRAAPLLLSSAEAFDPQQGGSLFRYLSLQLLVVERDGPGWRPALKNGRPRLLDPQAHPQYEQKTGRNTRYILHPEEVLADNFVHLVFQTPDLPSPQILEALRRALQGP